jgi:L-threonylcarbamoyladenylate synthase
MIFEASQDNISYIADFIKTGKVCVLPTDTLYGFSCSALLPSPVDKIDEIKGRDNKKPYIILISDIHDLDAFNINLTGKEKLFTGNVWPGKVTVVLPCAEEKFLYLHRGGNTLGFRIPEYQWLQDLLARTGPLISTTVNTSGEPPVTDIDEAERLFGNQVELFVNAGPLISEPSTVVSLENDTAKIIRQGAVVLKNLDLNKQFTA